MSSAWAVFRLGHFVGSLWCLMLRFLRNVARNSPTRISNVDITSLELQRFGVLHKVRVPELRASFVQEGSVGVSSACRMWSLSRRSRPVMAWLPGGVFGLGGGACGGVAVWPGVVPKA